MYVHLVTFTAIRIDFCTRNFWVKSLLIFKAFNRVLSCFQEDFTHANAQKSSVKETVTFYAPGVFVSQAPYIVPDK